MKIVATQKFSRQTPRKVRLVANQVKDLPLPQAIEQLGLIEKKSTLVILKTLRQALANAEHNHGLKLADLELENILITDGPRYRRFRAVSRGRAHGVLKRTCHVQVVLKTAETDKKAAQSTDKAAEPTKKAAPAKKETEAKVETTVKKKTKKTSTSSKKSEPKPKKTTKKATKTNKE